MPSAYSALINMKKYIYRVGIFAALSLSFFLNPLSVSHVEADYLKITAPAEVIQNTPFEITVEISAKASTNYSIKARLGNSSGQMTKGQTQDNQTGIWLSDSVAWDRFPKIQTDGSGHWQGTLKVKPTTTAALGTNLLVIRVQDNIDGSTKDSEPYQITINEAQLAPVVPRIIAIGEPILNEFLAAPGGGQEWVEIKNKGNTDADLSGWLIDDEEGKSSPFIIPQGTVVAANGFYVAYFSSPKLNDATDSVRLIKPDGTLVEEYRYNSPEKGKSFAKDSNGVWFTATEVSPGTNNPKPPISVGAADNTSKNKVLTAETTQNSEVELTTAPKLSVATKSAKIATVSASYKDSGLKEGWINKIPLFFGGLLILAAFGVLGKNIYLKARRDKTTIQPMGDK